jgi:ABC-type uncharacterized transport system auxiliary subunit
MMKSLIILILVTGLLLPGCRAGRTVTNRFYILEYPRDLSVTLPDPLITLDRSCFVSQVDVFPAFATNQIAYRENSHEIRYYSFNHWAVRPEASFTRMILTFFDTYPVFEQVYHDSPVHNADYTIETSVLRLEVVREGNDFLANLILKFRLTDNTTGDVVTEHNASNTTEIVERNLNLFAAAVNEMFIEEFSVFINAVMNNIEPDQ